MSSKTWFDTDKEPATWDLLVAHLTVSAAEKEELTKHPHYVVRQHGKQIIPVGGGWPWFGRF